MLYLMYSICLELLSLLLYSCVYKYLYTCLSFLLLPSKPEEENDEEEKDEEEEDEEEEDEEEEDEEEEEEMTKEMEEEEEER